MLSNSLLVFQAGFHVLVVFQSWGSLSRRLHCDVWQHEVEGCSPSDFRFNPYPAAVSFEDTLADRQTNTGARNLPRVQSLKGNEDCLVIFTSYPDTVVAYGKPQLAFSLPNGNVNPRGLFAAVLYRVPDQILE
jgi:hypothetical protein